MITQKYTLGNSEIKIEIAESLEDAEKNNFGNGEYSRYFVNGKAVSNYMTLIKYIVSEAHVNNHSLIQDKKKIEELRMELLRNQNNAIKEHLLSIRKQYGDSGVPEQLLQEVDNMIEKLDETGVRVRQ